MGPNPHGAEVDSTSSLPTPSPIPDPLFPLQRKCSDSNTPLLSTASGTQLPATLDSVLACASSALLPFFSTREATVLRSTYSGFAHAVAQFPWHDIHTHIPGPLVSWRRCFPHARAANLEGRPDVDEHAFSLLHGVRALNLNRCAFPISDRAIALLGGRVETLMMSLSATALSDAGFAPLAPSLKHLFLSGSLSAPALSAAAFAPLKSLTTLSTAGCAGLAFGPGAFSSLPKLRSLTIAGCRVDVEAFSHLPRLEHLDISACVLVREGQDLPALDASLLPLRSLTSLDVSGLTLSDASFSHLPLLVRLAVCGCTGFTAAAFQHLGAIGHLDLWDCPGVDDTSDILALKNLQGATIVV